MNTTLNNADWKSKRRRLILVATTAAISLGLLALGGKAITAQPDRSVDASSRNSAAFAPTASAAPAPAHSIVLAAGVQATDDTQVKLVTLTPRGFEPDEILVSQKRFVLAIDNRSQLDTISLQFSHTTGNPAAPLNQLQQLQMPRAKVNANTLFELPPGNYLLTEANHSNWVCRFTVISK